MLVNKALRIALAARRFREPVQRDPLNLATVLDWREIDVEGAELVDFVDGDLEAVFVEIGEAFEFAGRHVEQPAQLVDRELFLLLVFQADAPLDHLVEAGQGMAVVTKGRFPARG